MRNCKKSNYLSTRRALLIMEDRIFTKITIIFENNSDKLVRIEKRKNNVEKERIKIAERDETNL